MPDGWHTVEDVMRHASMSRYQVYRRIQDGKLPVQEANTGKRHYLISDEDLESFISAAQTPYKDGSSDTMPVREAAAATGLTADTIRRMCDEGELDHTRGKGLRGQYRISRASVQQYLEKRDQ